MLRMIFWFAVLVALAAMLAWFADRPGEITIDWLGYHIETSLAVALLVLLTTLAVLGLLWSLLRRLLHIPGALTGYVRNRRRRLGHEALSRGIVAVAARDREAALRLDDGQHRRPVALRCLALEHGIGGPVEAGLDAIGPLREVARTRLVAGLARPHEQAAQRHDFGFGIGKHVGKYPLDPLVIAAQLGRLGLEQARQRIARKQAGGLIGMAQRRLPVARRHRHNAARKGFVAEPPAAVADIAGDRARNVQHAA